MWVGITTEEWGSFSPGDNKNPALSLQKKGETRTGHLAEFGAVADRHGQRQGLKGETAAADRPSHAALKANAVIETKERLLAKETLIA